jgi:hypothetical protein
MVLSVGRESHKNITRENWGFLLGRNKITFHVGKGVRKNYRKISIGKHFSLLEIYTKRNP